MAKSLFKALAAFVLWLRGVGMGDRLTPKLDAGGGKSPDAGEGPDAGRGQAPETRDGQSATPASPAPVRVPPVKPFERVAPAKKLTQPAFPEELIARYARSERGTTALDELPFAPGEGRGGEERAPTSQEWMSALLEDHGVSGISGSREPVGLGDGTVEGGGRALLGERQRGPLARGERLDLMLLNGPANAEVLAGLRSFPPNLVPPGDVAHRERVHAVFDLGKLHLLQRLAAEPLFPYACRMWQPGKTDNNLELVRVLNERFGKLLGSIFNFEPAPLATGAAMPRRLHACYDEASGQLFLSARHLAGSLPDLMEALAHQQAHCLQHAIIRRLEAQDEKLTEAQSDLATAWSADFKRWRATCTPLTIGYHAHDLGGAVGKLFRQMADDERVQPSGPTPPGGNRV